MRLYMCLLQFYPVLWLARNNNLHQGLQKHCWVIVDPDLHKLDPRCFCQEFLVWWPWRSPQGFCLWSKSCNILLKQNVALKQCCLFFVVIKLPLAPRVAERPSPLYRTMSVCLRKTGKYFLFLNIYCLFADGSKGKTERFYKRKARTF